MSMGYKITRTIILLLLYLLTCSEIKSQDEFIKLINKANDIEYTYPDEAYRIADSLLQLNSFPKSYQSKVYLIKGDVQWEHSDFDSAIYFYEKAYVLSKSIDATSDICRSLSSLGYIYMEKGNMSKAITYYLQSIEVNNNRYPELKRNNYSYIALTYARMKDTSNALYYFREVLEIAKKEKNRHSEATCYTNMGTLYYELGLFNEAEKYFEKSQIIHKEIEDKGGFAGVALNLGAVYIKQKHFEKALDQLELVFDFAKKNNLKLIEMESQVYLGESNLALGKTEVAEKYFENAIKMSKASNSNAHIKNILGTISIAYADHQHFKKGFELMKTCLEYCDSLNLTENKKLMAENSSKFNLIQKQASINLLKKDNQLANEKLDSDRKIKILLSVIVGLIAIAAYFVYTRYRITIKQNKIIEEKQAETDRQKQEIEEKQKEIIDSIHYAKRIQSSLLTSEKYIHKRIQRLKL